MAFEIVHLKKEEWAGYKLDMRYETRQNFALSARADDSGWHIELIKRALDAPVLRDPSDALYAPFWENAYAWGAMEDGELIGAIETCPETWTTRLRVTELWVRADRRRAGVGHALMALAKEQARRERRRRIVLETQSCNAAAISFYQSEGFELIGYDDCCYRDEGAWHETRLEMGWRLPRRARVSEGDITIRPERPDDYFETENMVKRAFWNEHRPGCDEHYLTHKLRADDSYLPNLSRVAVADGKIVGYIGYAEAALMIGDARRAIATFGPLCVDPDWQGAGIGELLLRATLPLAAAAGYPGVVIFGEPTYYPRIGFATCDRFGITTADGKNYDAFMGYELQKGGLNGGRFIEPSVYENLPKDEVDRYDARFPRLAKLPFPDQWA